MTKIPRAQDSWELKYSRQRRNWSDPLALKGVKIYTITTIIILFVRSTATHQKNCLILFILSLTML